MESYQQIFLQEWNVTKIVLPMASRIRPRFKTILVEDGIRLVLLKIKGKSTSVKRSNPKQKIGRQSSSTCKNKCLQNSSHSEMFRQCSNPSKKCRQISNPILLANFQPQVSANFHPYFFRQISSQKCSVKDPRK